jgi:hypothetical protein
LNFSAAAHKRLREEQNRILRRIFGPKREKETGGGRNA